MRAIFCLGLLASSALAQSFEVASVKPSARAVGKDYRGAVVFGSERVSARNASLKGLIVEAYHVQPFQVSGGPRWVDAEHFDVEAKLDDSDARTDHESAMIKALLVDSKHFRQALYDVSG